MKKIFVCCILLSFAQFTIGQKKTTKTTDKNDSTLLKTTQFRLVGPFRGGRSGAVCGDLTHKNIFYNGTTGGGLWKTMDGGSNWKNISDKYFGGSIGAIAIAPSDADIMYVGEGESTLRGNVSEGFGIWRTTDAGRTWKNIGLKDTRHIVRVVIHPKNPDIVWVAAIGHLFGPNNERGVYKTIDGGKTWRKVLFSDNQSGAVDLVMEPSNPQTLYASTWTVIRTPYSLESGGKGSALWKSIDGGETWQKLNDKKGFPNKSILGIIGVAVSKENPELLYAIIENEKGGLYVSEDAGETWQLKNSSNDIRQRAWYYSKVFVDPLQSNIVYVLNVDFLKSTDGGATFKVIYTPHGDHHDLWIDPEDGKRMVIGDDGGAQISFDGGEHWSSYYNQPTAQFYRVSTDNHYPYRILGAQQDNSSVRILSRSNGDRISNGDWGSTAGFESGYIVADPSNPEIVYGGNYCGYLGRLDHSTGENRQISVWPVNSLGAGADIQKYRFQWNFPIFFSPHNPKRLYAAGNVLFVSENEGASWTALGGDLTTNDKDKQRASGGPITKDNTGVEVYCTIFTAAESVSEKDVLWTGSDDGLIHISKDGGKQWSNVTPPMAGQWMMWNCIETDHLKNGKAYIVGTKYKLDDYTPYVFKTEDYGKTWQKITNGIPSNHFARCIRVDKKRTGLLYCGTEYGLYISYDDGANWKSFQLNLPIVPITDMTIKENDLVLATQGRSFWVLDDLSTIQQMDKGIATKALFVYDVNPAYRYDGYQNKSVNNAGMNPANGVVVNYFAKEISDSSKIEITLRDKNNQLIRTYSNTASNEQEKIEINSGMNTFVWNMRYKDWERSENMIMWAGIGAGPKAAPGNYTAMIKIGNDSITKPFTVLANPSYKCSQADYDAQFQFLIQVGKSFNEIQNSIQQIRNLRQQMDDFKTKQGKACPKEIIALCDSINIKTTVIEEKFYQTKLKSSQDILNYPMQLNNKIANLYDYASSGNTAPTEQVKLAFKELSNEANQYQTNLKSIFEIDVKELNTLITKYLLPVIVIQPIK